MKFANYPRLIEGYSKDGAYAIGYRWAILNAIATSVASVSTLAASVPKMNLAQMLGINFARKTIVALWIAVAIVILENVGVTLGVCWLSEKTWQKSWRRGKNSTT